MRLVKVELTRLRWRRSVLLLLAAAVVLPIVFFAATAWETRPFSDAEVSEAKAQIERDNEYLQEELDNCVAHPRRYDVPADGDVEATCREWVGMGLDEADQLRNYLWRDQLTIPKVLEEQGAAVAVFMVVLALLMGTTFCGADWASGSMSNQLLFESRRTRLWLAKAAAVLVGGIVLALVGMALFWAMIGGLAGWRDVATNGTWDDVAGQVWRTAASAGGAAVIGHALTMLFRSTVATLGLTLAVAIGGSLLIALIPIDDPIPWMFHSNAFAILQDGFTYQSEVSMACEDFECYENAERTIGMAHGITYFGVLLLVAAGLSLASFRSRDVP